LAVHNRLGSAVSLSGLREKYKNLLNCIKKYNCGGGGGMCIVVFADPLGLGKTAG